MIGEGVLTTTPGGYRSADSLGLNPILPDSPRIRLRDIAPGCAVLAIKGTRYVDTRHPWGYGPGMENDFHSGTARGGQPSRPEFSTYMAKYIFEGVVMALDGFWRLPEAAILAHGEMEGRVIADTLIQAGIARWVEIDGRRDLAAPVPNTPERKELRKYARMMGARGGREAARKAKKMGFTYPDPEEVTR